MARLKPRTTGIDSSFGSPRIMDTALEPMLFSAGLFTASRPFRAGRL
jgi:hypothetical protein